jgi:hypothetical protein
MIMVGDAVPAGQTRTKRPRGPGAKAGALEMGVAVANLAAF